ncbi:MAG TPA: DJ-1/PfpI family protein [Candidatus Baltobacteraceae bacterium]|jgi:protease I|nr:DJ-1/PfpI family protein [Candidatus Baltobacteraceae bacterium]
MQGIDGKRIAALVAEGFEEAELAEPRRLLEEAGAVITIVGIDEKARQRIRGKRGLDEGAAVKAEEIVVDCTAEDFDALFIPGGSSPERLRTNREVQRFVREFDGTKKPIFSMGNGAQVLISSQLVRGRTLTGSPAIGDDIRNSGALYRDQPVVQDGNWISARTAADATFFHRTIVEKLSSAVSANS